MKSLLTQTTFIGSQKGEAILNAFTKAYDKDPQVIARREETARKEAIYNSRVLNTDAFKSWVEALRSGYKQKGWTRAPNKGKIISLKNSQSEYYSALGVLCDVTKDLTGGKWVNGYFMPQDESFTRGAQQERFYTPRFVEEKLGIKNIKSELIRDIRELAVMNVYLSFTEIADLIESEYVGRG